MTRRIMMEGVTFKQGTKVLKYLFNKNDQSYYECICTNCGLEFVQDGYSTRIGRQGCKNCKTRKDWCKEIENEPFQIGDLTRNWWAKRVLSVMKHRRLKNPNFEYNLDMSYCWDLFLKQDRKCIYTGILLDFPKKSTTGGTASLDRIDSSKGYIKGNVQWVHRDVNNMKKDLSHLDFLNFCQLIVKNIK